MKYGIVFWGTGCDSIKVFRMQKTVIRLIAGVQKYESCRHIFKDFKILTTPSLYILEVLCFINKNKRNLNNNCHIHNYNTRSKCDIHVQSCNTTQYPKSVINMGIRLFNNLPDKIKMVDNNKIFKTEVKLILLHNSFYSIQEYYNFNGF
jgi:hypothetical protein